MSKTYWKWNYKENAPASRKKGFLRSHTAPEWILVTTKGLMILVTASAEEKRPISLLLPLLLQRVLLLFGRVTSSSETLRLSGDILLCNLADGLVTVWWWWRVRLRPQHTRTHTYTDMHCLTHTIAIHFPLATGNPLSHLGAQGWL